VDDFRHDTDRNLLLEQGWYSDWADSLRKRGEILYTNVCHYSGLKNLSEIARFAGHKDDCDEFEFLAGKVKAKVNTMFWNGKYYNDSVGRGGDIFSSGGNILAVLWGVAEPKQAKKVFDYIKKYKMENFTLNTNHPSYYWWQISPMIKLIGLSEYHNGLRWLWLGCMDVAAKAKYGLKKEAKELLTKIAGKIIEFGSVYEVYEKTGKPIRRFVYKAEHPFAWSAGLFVYAVNEYNKMK